MLNTSTKKPVVKAFFDKITFTLSYLVKDPDSNSCAIIDPVLDFEYASGSLSYEGVNKIISYIEENDLSLEWIIETHVHADHLSSAAYVKEKLGGKSAIARQVQDVQEVFGGIFDENSSFLRDGSQFDHLFEDGERYMIGGLEAYVMHTPGHTPACMTHVIGDCVFVGDTVFMPDSGTSRADFPGADASILYHSIQKIFTLPDETRVFVCHDYQPNGRELEFETTIKEQKSRNTFINSDVTLEEFVAKREARDATLAVPRLILPSLQVNMRAGSLPIANTQGKIFLKLPVNAFK